MTLPTFSSFYEAIHDRPPFPWQVRLVDEILETGWTHRLLDLPTGTGKTSAFDVALYCLACAPERMPRRTLLVVDRRIVVDQGADHARKLRDRLEGATSGSAREIANALRTTCGVSADESCLEVAVLRGGMPRDNDWARRPHRPLLGVSTVDQVGSRLLFRGYGVKPLSASIFAGLLGNDTLILLDEVHLAVPFATTLDAIHSRFRSSHPALPDRFAVVQMSATAGVSSASKRIFRLNRDDESHPVLAQRLNARKVAKLVSVKASGDDEANKRTLLARRAISDAIALQRGGARVVAVVVNRVDTARLAVAFARSEHANETDSILVTGRMRPIDRDRIVLGDLARAAAGRERRPDDRPMLVIATQCIEAGADLDFDGLVTECASLDALRQRFGRVDRRGDLGETRSVILGRSDLVGAGATDPIYGDALAATWSWLGSHLHDESIDFGVRGLPAAVDERGTTRQELLPPVVDAPVMLPGHLDAWSQTSLVPEPDANVADWLHGPQRPDADVQVIWRRLPALEESNLTGILEELDAVRPSTLEAITLPVFAARRWLENHGEVPIADVVICDLAPEEQRRRPRVAQDNVALRWRGDGSELVRVDQIRPGDVLVVDRSYGGLLDDSFDPEARTAVLDVGDIAQLRARGVPTLRLTPDALRMWGFPADMIEALPSRTDDERLGEFDVRVRQWVEHWPATAPDEFPGTKEEWTHARKHLSSSYAKARELGPGYVLVAKVPRRKRREAKERMADEIRDLVTEGDDSSFRDGEVSLELHSSDVQALAMKYASAIGMGRDIVEDLALAGWLHDVGKADPRFQRWLVGGDEVCAAIQDKLLAKSALPPGSPVQRRDARERAGYPSGYRHELLSLAMVAANEHVLARAHDPALVLHLVASHHGWCRPFAPPIDDPEEQLVKLKHGDDEFEGETRHHLARLDSGVAERYWDVTKRYGWWGIAWLEAVLRLADHRASEIREQLNA